MMHTAFPEEMHSILASLCALQQHSVVLGILLIRLKPAGKTEMQSLVHLCNDAPSVIGDTPRYLRHSQGFDRSDKGPTGCAYIFGTGSHCPRELQILSGINMK